jgi:hypothetical protein
MRLLFPLVFLLVALQPARPPDIPFRTHTIDVGASETAAVADINRDGLLDIVSGEFWYEARRTREPGNPGTREPREWTKHRFRELGFSNQYIDNFSDLPVDVDGDQYPDIVSVSWFAKKVAWWRHPGKPGGAWKETPINSGFNVEFALLVDLDNDGIAREILAQENGTGQSWYECARGPSEAPEGSGDSRRRASASGGEAPRALRKDGGCWVKHVVSDRSYGHGIGAGDVNGDKRNDILTPRGWLEAPADPRSGPWTFHGVWESINVPVTPSTTLAKPGAPPRVAELGFMHVVDVNGDGRNDVVTAAGHDFGVFWFEQGENGQWTRRAIDSAWSQGHASTLVDLNGDGRLDLVTGKRFMAHNGSDPGEREPLGVYWYESRKSSSGNVEWIRHLVEYGGRVGGGMQIPVADIDADGDLDLVCPGKSGLFLVENLTKSLPTKIK